MRHLSFVVFKILLFDYKSKLHKLVVYKTRAVEKAFSQFSVLSLLQHYHDLKTKFYGKTTICLGKFSDLFDNVLQCLIMYQLSSNQNVGKMKIQKLTK